MTKTNKKDNKKQIVLTSEQIEAALPKYAMADAKLENISTKMDIDITNIREKYNHKLEDSKTAKEEYYAIIKAYALANKEELFKDKKSVETQHGVFGFRLSQPKLKPMKDFTWDDVFQNVKELLPEYIRCKEVLDRQRLLTDRDEEEVANMLERIGVQVVQEEVFYVEPKKEIINDID